MSESEDIVIVYEGSSVDASFVKSVLEGDGIECFLLNEAMGTIAPWQVSAGGVGAVKVIVRREDIGRAEVLVQEYNNSRSDESNEEDED